MSHFFQILGSLGVFLFGMRLMSESIQRIYGERLRKIMSTMTRDRFTGLMTGFLITCLVQSSSATTVMVVSFVHARLLTLVESIGVIMGANLGTTSTFWIISFFGFKFSITKIAIPVIGIGVAMSCFRSGRIKDTGNFLTGFGLLFLGLSLLKNAIPDVRGNPDALEWVNTLAHDGFSSILLFILFGVILTVVVQSSSVAGAIILTMAYNGWIDYHHAAAIILGENVGTTINAYLASLKASTAAKRAGRAHFLFNVIGVIWMLALFYPFTAFVDAIMPGSPTNYEDLPLHVAAFHTLFNLANIVLLIGLVPRIARLVEMVVKEKPKSEARPDYKYLTSFAWGSGELNFIEAKEAINQLGQVSRNMFDQFLYIYRNPEQDLSAKVKEINRMEDEANAITGELFDFLIRCSSDQVSEDTRRDATAYLRVIAELEEVCDCCHRLTNRAVRRYRKHRFVPKEVEEDVVQLGEVVSRFISFYQQKLKDPAVSSSDMEVAVELEDLINSKRKQLRKRSVSRMHSDSQGINGELIYVEIVNTFERIGNHARNIVQSLPVSTD